MKRFLSLLFSIVIIVMSVTVASAAEDTLSVNSAVELKAGDILSYTLYLSDCEQPIVDMAAYIYYDSEYLELDADSLAFPSLMGVNRNTNLPDYIPFNFSALSNPVDFSQKKPLVTLDFTAKKGGAADIRYFVGEMEYMKGESNVTVKSFSFTCDYAVNGEIKAESAVPKLLSDENELNERQGGFINYADGKGENASGEEHTAVTGEIQTVTAPKESSNNSLIFILAGILIALAIAVLIVLRKRFASDNAEEDEEYEDDFEEETDI